MCVCICGCCLTRRTSESGVAIRLLPASAWHVISGSEYARRHHHDGRLCDLLAHTTNGEPVRIIVVELKSRGALNAGHVADQLQGGIDLLTGKAPAQCPEPEIFLVHSGISGPEVEAIRRKQVLWRGKKLPIRLKRTPFAA